MPASTAVESHDEPIAPAPTARRAWIWAGLVVIACVQPLAQLLSRQHWRADLLSHFPEPALVYIFVLLAIAVRRRPRLAVALALLAAWQAAAVFRYAHSNPAIPDPNSHERLKVLMANVFVENNRYEDLARLIRQEQPDIVALVEYSHAWQEGVDAIRKEFSEVAEFPDGAAGLALWFRRPPRSISPATRLRGGDRPFLHASFEFAGSERHLFLLHPRQPFDLLSRQPGNPELAALGREIKRVGGSCIVTGDFNTSDGSSNFAAFVRETGLRDSRFGFGRQGSFPTSSPYRIAIDHALVPPDLAVVERRLGPSIGSDHYPLIFVLAPASDRKSATTSPTRSSHKSP
ncbi:MAG: endonuclease/exonuclease/phosphatase family protein [Isosphaeraceae bacterium]|nr:endonuclease/exonuclease/phosphatase family protein [Isosphaeraceae bacterium]